MNTRRASHSGLALSSRSSRHAFGLAAAMTLSIALAACSGGDVSPTNACHPSDPGCTAASDGGASGDRDGSASADGGGAVDHDSGTAQGDAGQTPQDGGHGPGTGDGGGPHDSGLGAEGGAGGFSATCTVNADCPATYPVCFNFNAKGHHCTKACAAATDCPNPPNLGCSGMGVCKIP